MIALRTQGVRCRCHAGWTRRTAVAGYGLSGGHHDRALARCWARRGPSECARGVDAKHKFDRPPRFSSRRCDGAQDADHRVLGRVQVLQVRGLDPIAAAPWSGWRTTAWTSWARVGGEEQLGVLRMNSTENQAVVDHGGDSRHRRVRRPVMPQRPCHPAHVSSMAHLDAH